MTVDVSTDRPLLRALAEELGIVPGYHDQTGAEWRETSDETRVLLLAAMGVDASTEAAAEAALERSGGRIKIASLIALGSTPDEAAAALGAAGGDLRRALGAIGIEGK